MAVLNAPNNLQTAQTGNADSTNIIKDTRVYADTGRPATIKIVSTVGATPTVTVTILGSPDGVGNWESIPYALPSAPTQYTEAPIVITTATTGFYLLQSGLAFTYVKLNMSANTNVTLTSDYT